MYSSSEKTTEQTSSATPHPRFRFSLRTLFVVVTVGCVWLGWNLYQVRQRELLHKYLVSSAEGIYNPDQVAIKPWKKLPLVWSWFGAKPIGAIQLRKTLFSDDDRRHIEGLFPEASVVFDN